jgi:hypothetical protein
MPRLGHMQYTPLGLFNCMYDSFSISLESHGIYVSPLMLRGIAIQNVRNNAPLFQQDLGNECMYFYFLVLAALDSWGTRMSRHGGTHTAGTFGDATALHSLVNYYGVNLTLFVEAQHQVFNWSQRAWNRGIQSSTCISAISIQISIAGSHLCMKHSSIKTS